MHQQQPGQETELRKGEVSGQNRGPALAAADAYADVRSLVQSSVNHNDQRWW